MEAASQVKGTYGVKGACNRKMICIALNSQAGEPVALTVMILSLMFRLLSFSLQKACRRGACISPRSNLLRESREREQA